MGYYPWNKRERPKTIKEAIPMLQEFIDENYHTPYQITEATQYYNYQYVVVGLDADGSQNIWLLCMNEDGDIREEHTFGYWNLSLEMRPKNEEQL